MSRKISMSLGALFLLAGVVLLTKMTGRLRADPSGGICPMKDLTSVTQDCVASMPCTASGSLLSCLAVKGHWEVEQFEQPCVTTPKPRQCKLVTALCKTFIVCVYDVNNIPPCQKAGKQPPFPDTQGALEPEAEDCP